jgi:DNA helicase II / ATP-dependent DNA helicase PcrA
MISEAQFLAALRDVIGRPLDDEQRAVVLSSRLTPLIVVAGPGTGKTTAITSRALKFVFVDRLDPGCLLLTTFTKKAAMELRSRLLGWGVAVREVLLERVTQEDDRSFLSELDINRFVTGTLDSLAEQFLDRYRDFETVPPVVLDEFVANSVLLRDGLFANRLYEDQDLANFAASQGRAINPRLGRPTVDDLKSFARVYADRLNHDLIDLRDFAELGPGPAAMSRVIEQYRNGLTALGEGVTDFSLLERMLLDRIRAGALNDFTSELGMVQKRVDSFVS